ncbi:MAG: nucleotide sugar dehydrogenase [Fervidicoccaceae archaeon]
MNLLSIGREEASAYLKEGKITVSVFGLGKMGLPLALVFAENGAKVIGVDINEKTVEELMKGRNPIPFEPGTDEMLERALRRKNFIATTDGTWAASQSNLIIVIVPVYASRTGIDFRSMDAAINSIGKGLRKGSIVVTETTLPPGTTEKYAFVLESMSGLKAGEDFGIAHAPERTMSGRVVRDITESYPKIIGAINKSTLEPLIGIYETINKKGVIPVSSIRAAEAVKVFEGVYRDVNIALANELALISEELGLSVNEIINAANSQPYSHIHKPGAGVGGHCIPVYPWFLIHAFPELARIVRLSREINELMPVHMVELTLRALNAAGRPLNGSRLIVLGLSYRGEVKEHVNTPTLPLVRELEAWGSIVEVLDPFYSEEELRSLGLQPFSGDFKGADGLIVVTDHKLFRNLDLKSIAKIMRTPVIVDGRHIFLGNPMLEDYFYIAPGEQLKLPRKGSDSIGSPS